ncbi:MAG: hypothetical protein O3C21_19635 [Verrucomicrobia bacterium]|nr:hypothetical protein [Verrucomicrobiota bacterium]
MTPALMKDLVNGAEIIVWIAIAAALAHKVFTGRKDYWLPAFAFFAFGISDAVEMTTGAWWKPWWLLVCKVACLCFIIRFFWQAFREHRKK